MKTLSNALFSSRFSGWKTPRDLFRWLDERYGPFLLDAAADEETALCSRYLRNGLEEPWDAVTYCNPPYGRRVGLWVEKAWREVQQDRCPRAVLLLAARTDTAWFHDLVVRYASEVLFLRGRLRFENGKNSTGPAPFPSMVVVFERDRRGQTWSSLDVADGSILSAKVGSCERGAEKAIF